MLIKMTKRIRSELYISQTQKYFTEFMGNLKAAFHKRSDDAKILIDIIKRSEGIKSFGSERKYDV
ncbi:MAG: hypothetical protein D6735_15340 [Acidobacteria bacterium]|nr:MAG: hypothetical protein D6735_15340 [Acidobacteriota bacterium]